MTSSHQSAADAQWLASCDWGDCEDARYGIAYDDEHGWLPVCRLHYAEAKLGGHKVRQIIEVTD